MHWGSPKLEPMQLAVGCFSEPAWEMIMYTGIVPMQLPMGGGSGVVGGGGESLNSTSPTPCLQELQQKHDKDKQTLGCK